MNAYANSLARAAVPTAPTPGAPTVAETLAAAATTLAAAGVGSPRLDADVLLAAACGTDRAGLYVRSHEIVPPPAAERFAGWLARRADREPVAYILGRQEFWSLDFVVTPAVLVPRPETELLVELTLVVLGQHSLSRMGVSINARSPFDGLRVRGKSSMKSSRDPLVLSSSKHERGENRQFRMGEARGEGESTATGRSWSICDLATGSGCVAVTLAREVPHATLWALDVSEAALAVAATNARQHGVADRVRAVHSDLFAAVPGRRFDVIVTNPPYVARGDLCQAQRELAFEPRLALDGGETGLDVVSRIVAAAQDHLVPGGWLVLEIGADQGAAATALAGRAGLHEVAVRRDHAGLPRVLMGRRS